MKSSKISPLHYLTQTTFHSFLDCHILPLYIAALLEVDDKKIGTENMVTKLIGARPFIKESNLEIAIANQANKSGHFEKGVELLSKHAFGVNLNEVLKPLIAGGKIKEVIGVVRSKME